MNSCSKAILKPSKDVVPLSTWILISKLKVEYMLTRGADGSFNRNLAEFHDRKASASLAPHDGVASMDVTIDRSSGLWSRIFLPAIAYAQEEQENRDDKVPIIFYFHGGSYAHSSANTALYDMVCRQLCRTCRAVVISVNYRRAPEHRCPAAYRDGLAALRWLRLQAARHVAATWLPPGADLSRCFLAGDSSGGNMVHHVGVAAATARHELWPVRVVGHVLLMPMFGGVERTASERRLDGQYFVTVKDRDYYWKLFLPEGADRDHPACNVFGPGSAAERVLGEIPVPKSLVVVAGLDLTQDWQLRYARGMERSGKSVEVLVLEDTPVGFFIFPNTEQYYRVMDKIRGFVRDEEEPMDSSTWRDSSLARQERE
ncbi:hypothetical protein SELMODRAFT_271143 [Selaginella moellendorffii]|uniref:Uncharacterized protein GID1a-2 n=1 Tax=Selaginella moellendorffii TaxID=88036 RepID=D8RWM7_SELML|nr:gibberellin receptor GID1C isoform X2 [Selaginella moellendorffii]EFJ23284.1 hypothetical protein SELMODRAFT_271143 [Selaginella moellendorffii]|eukprot:XP_002975655.1 gibberellin receptor GID1C isoform X2 [Selaginella moellendorffii]